MKADMELFYVSDMSVEIKVVANIESVELKFKDGDNNEHFVMSADDAEELSRMLSCAAKHYIEMQSDD